MGVLVWVDEWQFSCCGDPFGIGDAVAWLLKPVDAARMLEVLGPEIGRLVVHAEERHDQSEVAHRHRGRVDSLRMVCRRMDGGAELIDIVRTHGADPDRDLHGYLVELTLWE